jgi:uncharacterized membrane protein YeaQ/YmgE (transglycosylase-associated protein family)
MNILAWIVIGIIAGWLAGQVMKGSGFGLVGDLIVGVVGALLGGFLAGVLFGGDFVTGINLTTLIVAFVGACILLFIMRAIPGRGRA